MTPEAVVQAANGYCDSAPGHPLHGWYHERVYGFPVDDDDELFARLTLEIHQAGLSWLLILKKRAALYRAFDGFKAERVASFDERRIAALLQNSEIIRNRRKIEAAVANAASVVRLRKTHGSFKAWLDQQHPLSHGDWVKALRAQFRFIGPEVTREFLLSTGYLEGAHRRDCPVYHTIAALRPPWMRRASPAG